MKVVVLILLALSAASCAEEQKKQEKRGLLSLGYGLYTGNALGLSSAPSLQHAPATFTLSHAPTLTVSHTPVSISTPSISHALTTLSVSAPTVAHAPSVSVGTPAVAHAPTLSLGTPAVSHGPLTTISQVSYDTTHYTPVVSRVSSAPLTLQASAPAAPSLVYSQGLTLGYAPTAPALSLGYGHGIDYGFTLGHH